MNTIYRCGKCGSYWLAGTNQPRLLTEGELIAWLDEPQVPTASHVAIAAHPLLTSQGWHSLSHYGKGGLYIVDAGGGIRFLITRKLERFELRAADERILAYWMPAPAAKRFVIMRVGEALRDLRGVDPLPQPERLAEGFRTSVMDDGVTLSSPEKLIVVVPEADAGSLVLFSHFVDLPIDEVIARYLA
ncbi:hypothetical protein [Herbiconiux liukaitaii]|uniref:hypothetical protein n=1 Tax=Herbiconiux liukaitaii TaxID=3342799 RepID=UPI0035BB23CA